MFRCWNNYLNLPKKEIVESHKEPIGWNNCPVVATSGLQSVEERPYLISLFVLWNTYQFVFEKNVNLKCLLFIDFLIWKYYFFFIIIIKIIVISNRNYFSFIIFYPYQMTYGDITSVMQYFLFIFLVLLINNCSEKCLITSCSRNFCFTYFLWIRIEKVDIKTLMVK